MRKRTWMLAGAAMAVTAAVVGTVLVVSTLSKPRSIPDPIFGHGPAMVAMEPVVTWLARQQVRTPEDGVRRRVVIGSTKRTRGRPLALHGQCGDLIYDLGVTKAGSYVDIVIPRKFLRIFSMVDGTTWFHGCLDGRVGSTDRLTFLDSVRGNFVSVVDGETDAILMTSADMEGRVIEPGCPQVGAWFLESVAVVRDGVAFDREDPAQRDLHTFDDDHVHWIDPSLVSKGSPLWHLQKVDFAIPEYVEGHPSPQMTIKGAGDEGGYQWLGNGEALYRAWPASLGAPPAFKSAWVESGMIRATYDAVEWEGLSQPGAESLFHRKRMILIDRGGRPVPYGAINIHIAAGKWHGRLCPVADAEGLIDLFPFTERAHARVLKVEGLSEYLTDVRVDWNQAYLRAGQLEVGTPNGNLLIELPAEEEPMAAALTEHRARIFIEPLFALRTAPQTTYVAPDGSFHGAWIEEGEMRSASLGTWPPGKYRVTVVDPSEGLWQSEDVVVLQTSPTYAQLHRAAGEPAWLPQERRDDLALAVPGVVRPGQMAALWGLALQQEETLMSGMATSDEALPPIWVRARGGERVAADGKGFVTLLANDGQLSVVRLRDEELHPVSLKDGVVGEVRGKLRVASDDASAAFAVSLGSACGQTNWIDPRARLTRPVQADGTFVLPCTAPGWYQLFVHELGPDGQVVRTYEGVRFEKAPFRVKAGGSLDIGQLEMDTR